MKFLAIAFALASVVPHIASMTINTPTSVVVCEPILFTWSGGDAPYYLSLLPGGQVSAAAIRTFDTQNGNQFTWLVDLPAGISITVSLKDNSGAQAYSDTVNIQGGAAGSGCLNGSNSNSTPQSSSADLPDAGTTAGAPASTTAAGPVTTSSTSHASAASTSAQPAATHSTVTAGNSAAHPASSTAAAPSASHSTKSNAASRSFAEFYAFAGAIGLAGVLF